MRTSLALSALLISVGLTGCGSADAPQASADGSAEQVAGQAQAPAPAAPPEAPAASQSGKESAVAACQHWVARAKATDGSSTVAEQRALALAQEAATVEPAFKLFSVDMATAARLSDEAFPPEGGVNLNASDGYIAALKTVNENCASVGVVMP